nr:FAD-linked oxidoreductase [Hypoxylon rubiginosum]
MLSQLFQVLALASLSIAANPNYEDLFKPFVSPGTEIATVSEPDFAEVASPRWSTWQPPTFQAAIKPVTEADVQAIVRIASRNKIPFLATLNGHGSNKNYARVQNALNINLKNFNSVVVDAVNNRLTIGGGVTFGQISEPLEKAGKEIQTGNAVCVGMVGATIGGGIGTLQGLHGLVLDALVSVKLVTAKGDLVVASKLVNPDLFWAIRGAGANFGIIVSATYEVYDQTSKGEVILASFGFPLSASRTAWEFVHSYDEHIPAPLVVIPAIRYNHTTQETSLNVAVVYYGTMAEAQPYLDQVAALNPISTAVQTVTNSELHEIFSMGACDRGGRHNGYTLGMKKTDPDTMEEIMQEMNDFYETHPNYNGSVSIQRYSNEAAMKVPDNDTSYPWRDINSYLLFDNVYADPALDADVDDLSRSLRDKLQAASGYQDPQIYLNYAHGDEPLNQVYGASKLPKLRTLKKKWDPDHLFGFNFPIDY